MKNTRGLSAVVTTLIIILLVLVAIGIIWVVIRNVVEKGTENIDVSVKCLEVDVRATAADCTTPTACTYTLERKAGGDTISGVKLVFSNATETSAAVDVPGNIAPLGTKQGTNDSTLGSVTKLSVTPYFEIAGEETLCSQSSEFTL